MCPQLDVVSAKHIENRANPTVACMHRKEMISALKLFNSIFFHNIRVLILKGTGVERKGFGWMCWFY